MCLYSPVWLEAKSRIQITIGVHGFEDSVVEAEVWHIRRQQVRKTSRKIWVVGVVLEKSDDAYLKLLAAAGLAPERRPAQTGSGAGAEASTTSSPTSRTRASSGVDPSDSAHVDSLEPKVFRVRVQARTGPRTRLLTLTAESEAEAHVLATRDLQPEWKVVQVIPA